MIIFLFIIFFAPFLPNTLPFIINYSQISVISSNEKIGGSSTGLKFELPQTHIFIPVGSAIRNFSGYYWSEGIREGLEWKKKNLIKNGELFSHKKEQFW